MLALLLLAAVLDLVRRRHLREEFSWVWVVGAATALALGAFARPREAFASALGVDEGLGVLTMAVFFLVLVALDISIKVSRLANHQKNLAQTLGRLDKRLCDLEERAPDE